MTAFLKWSDDFSVDYPCIDIQHQQIIALLNVIYEMAMGLRDLTKTKKFRSQTKILANLLLYTKTHFAYEEELMAATHSPLLAEHKKQHQELAKKTEGFARSFVSTSKAVDYPSLIAFLRDWWVDHIMKEDKKYAPRLKMLDING
jgi:hemerythrin-like metal-binding protein